MAGLTLDTVSADEARARLVDQLLTDGRITSPAVEAAFRRVPRHLFAIDGVTIDAAYADDVVITRRGPDGRAKSSISAPWLSLSTPVVLRSVRHRLDASFACSLWVSLRGVGRTERDCCAAPDRRHWRAADQAEWLPPLRRRLDGLLRTVMPAGARARGQRLIAGAQGEEILQAVLTTATRKRSSDR
ncbi:hypothetical protein [Micromonospora trifolii]|uniref:hypothetical protein n=1 Tax=Micromonospora trifolii TaxID=2911208 RepID=UPI003CEE9810